LAHPTAGRRRSPTIDARPLPSPSRVNRAGRRLLHSGATAARAAARTPTCTADSAVGNGSEPPGWLSGGSGPRGLGHRTGRPHRRDSPRVHLAV